MKNMERRLTEDNLLGANINQWAGALRESKPDLAEHLDEPREVGYENLEKWDLPRVPLNVVDLEDFLCFPEEFVKIFGVERVVVNLCPERKGLARYAKVGVTATELADFIKNQIREEDVDQYRAYMMPYWPERSYSGNVVVNPDGKMLMEFREGDPGPVASGRETPPYAVWKDKTDPTFSYSFEDQSLRERMYQTFRSIPHDGQEYLPGYYEFIWCKVSEEEQERLFFIDYRDNPAYFLPED
jgi:hypothetical protein